MHESEDNSAADICIFVEGTYPYVTGGVSSWLHNLITNLPQFTFALCHLGSRPDPDRSIKYQLPSNVVNFQEIFLNSSESLQPRTKFHSLHPQWKTMEMFHASVEQHSLIEAVETLKPIVEPGAGHLDASALFYSYEAWDLLVKRYAGHSPQPSFLDYFWTFRSTHLPLFILNDVELPRARLYHAVSTGYAGYAAALARLKTGRPLLITEHGIYTRERDMELALATWIDRPVSDRYRLDPDPGVFKTWWTNMFRFMSGFTYHMADCVISITQVNQQFQLRDGAQPAKLRLIPNGVDVDRLARIRNPHRAPSDHFTIGFVGRVVPIKDVKTFVQSVKIASAAIPSLRALIIGPTDEDPDYYQECQELVDSLDLAGVVEFTGRGDVLQYYPHMDILALTSLSEGQPLVILEASCAGVPVVASDVGACRDLLEGITAEDKALGPSGLLTLPASPHQTAESIVQLWADEGLRSRMAQAGQERVARFYREDTMYAAYRDLYQHYLQQAAAGEGDVAWPG